MDPQFLLKDEVEFELACRGYVQPGFASALKLVLKKMIQVESSHQVSYEIKAPPASINNPGKELEICSEKLEIILRYISELNEKPDKNLYKRLVSRLFHVVNRLKLIAAVDEMDKERQKVLTDKAVILLRDLESKDDLEDDTEITPDMKDALHNSLGEDGKLILNKIENEAIASSSFKSKLDKDLNLEFALTTNGDKRVDFVSDEDNIATLNRPRASVSNVFNSTALNHDYSIRKLKLVPISQWGVQFSGDNTFSVNAFIERVNELKEARNATDDDLWRHAIDFFRGDALIWFRANKEYVENWNELVLLLKRSFQSPYYQEELLSEAKARTQGKNESVLIFVSVMQNMFNRLPKKISESEKIIIICRNLLPYYQKAVCRDVFTTITDLVNVLRVIERTKINCENFHEPNTYTNVLEPDLAYKSSFTVNNNETCVIKSGKSNINLVKLRCWNCRETGHTFRSCTLPKQRLFCYKCGQFGVTSKDCRCKGNLKGEDQKPVS